MKLRHRTNPLGALLSMVAFQLAPYAATADDVVCASEHSRAARCEVSVYTTQVVLLQPLSDGDSDACIEGQSWGFDGNGIWVDHGCRALFRAYQADHGSETGRSAMRAYSQPLSITCASEGFTSNHCYVGGRVQSARLQTQLSAKPCLQGRSWGYDANSVWVAGGCSATFSAILLQ